MATGCFWEVGQLMKKLDGVVQTTMGYTGGKVTNPTYEEVSLGMTHHLEAVEVLFDPKLISYEAVAKIFFENELKNRPLIGSQYKSAFFYLDLKQKETIENLVNYLKQSMTPVSTEVIPGTVFYPADK